MTVVLNDYRLDVRVILTRPDGSKTLSSHHQEFNPHSVPIEALKTSELSALVCNAAIRAMQEKNMLKSEDNATLFDNFAKVGWSMGDIKRTFSQDPNERFGDDEI